MGNHLYLVVPLLAAMLAAGFGAAILIIGPQQRPNRASAALLLGGSFWGACEVLWNLAPEAGAALWIHRLSAPGWVLIGPHAVNLACNVSEVKLSRLQDWLLVFYAVGAVFVLATWTSDAMLAAMTPAPWGWALVPGPLFPVWFAGTAVLIATALVTWVRAHQLSRSAVDRNLGRRTAFLMTLPLVAGSFTDAILPCFGIQLPRLGALALATIGGLTIFALKRYGFSMLDTAAFSRRVLRTLPDGVALTSLNGRIRLANARMDELLGCRPGGALGLALREHLELPLLDPPMERREEPSELVQLPGGRIPVAVSAAPITDERGTPLALVVVVRDQREIASLRLRLVTSSRMAAVGQLAAGIAHEINNPLAFVRANLGHLRSEWEPLAADLAKGEGLADPRVDEWGSVLEESLEGVDRAVAIVRDIRDFSHAGGEATELADVNALVEAALRVAAPQIAPGTRVERAFGDVPPLLCGPQRLKQLFLNLIVNAAQAVGEGGCVGIATAREGERAVVRVSDDGCGIEAHHLERIFDPFFTTKPAGEGTGLGLAISHEIARSHGGEIHVESEPGRGTTVRVELPLASRAPAEARDVPSAAPARPGPA